jgi:hypothetical protein
LTFDVSGPDALFSEIDFVGGGMEIDLAFSPRIGFLEGEARIFLTLKGIRASIGEEQPATSV